MDNGYDLGLLLKKLRIKAGLSQQALGDKISRDKGIISRYENNYQTPPFETMRDFAVIFNVSMDYLAGMEKQDILSLRGMTDEQTDIIIHLADIFRTHNIRNKYGFSSEEYEILGKIVAIFAKAV